MTGSYLFNYGYNGLITDWGLCLNFLLTNSRTYAYSRWCTQKAASKLLDFDAAQL